jgi:hypothetical protein
MMTKKTRAPAVALIAIVVLSAAAWGQAPYPGGANRWVYVHENLGPQPPPQPAGELFAATWGALSGTVNAVGKTFGAVLAAVVPVEKEAAPEKPCGKASQLRYRFMPRFHGMSARWIVAKECP